MNTRTRMSAIVATLGLVGSLALATASADESRTPGSAAQIALTEVARAQNPTAGAAGPQDTVWIAERAGTVRVLGDDGLGEPVLDISDETTTDGERGLLGLAFDE
ncbi:sugar dehydrogenase, partial [Streptomyces violaceoruber]